MKSMVFPSQETFRRPGPTPFLDLPTAPSHAIQLPGFSFKYFGISLWMCFACWLTACPA